jgi:hypothetical protein
MDTTDVDSNADRAQERFTNHFFARSPFSGYSGLAARVPSNMTMWPPSVLFDAVYACAVAFHYGSGLADVLKNWEDVFYPDEPAEAAHTDDNGRRDQVAAQEKSDRQKAERKERFHMRQERERARNAIHPHDLLMMYRFRAMEPEKVRAYLRGCKEMAAARERKGLEEKVNSWREGVVGTSNSIGID